MIFMLCVFYLNHTQNSKQAHDRIYKFWFCFIEARKIIEKIILIIISNAKTLKICLFVDNNNNNLVRTGKSKRNIKSYYFFYWSHKHTVCIWITDK